MRIIPLILLTPVVIAVSGLLTGAAWLVRPTPGLPALPLGNLAIWLAFVSLALLVLDQASHKRRNGLRLTGLGLLVLALAWAPLGYLASGNWRFVFSGDRTWLDVGIGPGLQSWWAISGTLAGVLLVSAIVALLLKPAPTRPVSKNA
jgi:hypothetical protein